MNARYLIGVASLMVAITLVLPSVSATTVFDNPWGVGIVNPTAVSSHRLTHYTGYGVSTTAPGAQMERDGILDKFSSESSLVTPAWAQVGAYTQPAVLPFGQITHVMPVAPDNSTIGWILALAIFKDDSGPYGGSLPSNVKLNYSKDGGSTWSNFSASPKVWDIIPHYYYVWWNITSMEAWTPALVKSTSFYMGINFDIPAGVAYPKHFYPKQTSLDYLGISYEWHTPGYAGYYEGWTPGSTGTNDTLTPGATPIPHFNFPSFGGSWMIKVFQISLGLIGCIGMIGYPAAAIKSHKRGSNMSDSLVSGITLEAIFIVMFYAALVL